MLRPLISIVKNSLFKIQLTTFWQSTTSAALPKYAILRAQQKNNLKERQRQWRRIAT
jgi:hypothetical protein